MTLTSILQFMVVLGISTAPLQRPGDATADSEKREILGWLGTNVGGVTYIQKWRMESEARGSPVQWREVTEFGVRANYERFYVNRCELVIETSYKANGSVLKAVAEIPLKNVEIASANVNSLLQSSMEYIPNLPVIWFSSLNNEDVRITVIRAPGQVEHNKYSGFPVLVSQWQTARYAVERLERLKEICN